MTFVEFPGALPIMYAMRVVLESRELRDRHNVSLRLVTEHDRVLEEITGQFLLPDARTEEEAALGAVIPLNVFQIERPGRYLIKTNLDDLSLGTLPLRVERSS